MTTDLWSILEDQLEIEPSAPAVIHDSATWSFRQLTDRASALASATTRDLTDGQTVAVLGENHPDTIAAYYGIPASGRVLTFLNHRLSDAELRSQVARARVGSLIVSSEQAGRLEDVLPESSVVGFGDELAAGSALEARGEGRRPAWLLFTSGTTGSPKGALLSQTSLLAAIHSSSQARPIPSDDVFAFPFPLCHVAGYNVLRTHERGRPVVLLSRFTPEGLVEIIAKHNVTSVSLAATMLSDLLDYLDRRPDDLALMSSLRTISYGASPMPVELLLRADRLLGVDLSQGFGMTELSGNAVFLDSEAHRRGLTGDQSILAAAGSPGPGVELRLVDSDDIEVASGEIGEICVRGEQAMIGYLDDPEATAAALRGGWMHTGDLGRMRGDGLLEVVDRLKDMIVTGGENVASLEVERAVTAVCPEVIEVCVVGVPDPRWGENVCACVQLTEGCHLDVDEVARRLVGRLAGFKTPRHLVVLDSLPRTHSGKAAKAELRTLLLHDPGLLGPRRSSSS